VPDDDRKADLREFFHHADSSWRAGRQKIRRDDCGAA
jgi:hypothetical protein